MYNEKACEKAQESNAHATANGLAEMGESSFGFWWLAEDTTKKETPQKSFLVVESRANIIY